jgi:hypothetical protein
MGQLHFATRDDRARSTEPLYGPCVYERFDGFIVRKFDEGKVRITGSDIGQL